MAKSRMCINLKMSSPVHKEMLLHLSVLLILDQQLSDKVIVNFYNKYKFNNKSMTKAANFCIAVWIWIILSAQHMQ